MAWPSWIGWDIDSSHDNLRLTASLSAQSKRASQYLHVNGDICGKPSPGHTLPLVLAVLHAKNFASNKACLTSRGFLQNGRALTYRRTQLLISALFLSFKVGDPGRQTNCDCLTPS